MIKNQSTSNLGGGDHPGPATGTAAFMLDRGHALRLQNRDVGAGKTVIGLLFGIQENILKNKKQH